MSLSSTFLWKQILLLRIAMKGYLCLICKCIQYYESGQKWAKLFLGFVLTISIRKAGCQLQGLWKSKTYGTINSEVTTNV